MADLGNVVIEIQADTSKLDDIISAVGKVESAVRNLQSTFNSMGSNASSSTSKAQSGTDDLASSLETAAAKGALLADAVENVLNKVADLAVSGVKALEGFVEGCVQSYASFEQMYDASSRFVQETSSGLSGGAAVMAAYTSTIDDAGTSFRDVGVSMTEFYDLANTLVPRLANANAEARAKEQYEAENVMIETVDARKAALDSELSALKASLNQQYNEQKAAYSADEKAYKAALNQKYEDDKEYWDKQITLFKRNNEDIYNAQKEEFAKQDEQLKQQLDDELTAFKQAKSDEYDALKDSLQAQYDAEKQARSDALAQFKENLNAEYYALKDSLDAQYDLLKSNLDKQVDAKKRANDKAVDERQRQLDKEYSALQRSLDKEVSAFQRATDARVREINREYTEKLKLIDEEKYNALKAIDDQLDAIDRQAEEEERAAKLREYNDKLEQHKRAMNTSTCTAERIAAEEAYQRTLAEMQAYTAKNEQADQKENLRKQREEVSRHYDQLKAEVKDEQSKEVDEYKTQRSVELEDLRNHNKDVLAERKQANKDAIQAMKDANAEEIAALKETNKEILREAKDNNDGLLRERKNANSALIRQQQQDDQAYLKALQNDNEATLREVQRANDAEVRDRQRANKEILDNQKDDHDRQLKQLQRDLADDLEAYKSSVDDVLDEKKRQYDTDYENYQEYHRQMLAELKEFNRVYAEQETQKTKEAKKGLSEDDWKNGLEITPNAADYDKALKQTTGLAQNIADVVAVTDDANAKLSMLGPLYGRYFTFDNIKLPYKNKTGIQQMIEDAYAATRDMDEGELTRIFGSSEDPFAGLEVSVDNISAYLAGLQWALDKYNYSGTAAAEATDTLSGAWRQVATDSENLQTILAMSDEEMQQYGINLNEYIDDMTDDLVNFLMGNGLDERDPNYFGGLVERVTNVLNNITETIKNRPDIPKAIADLFGAAAGMIGTALAPLVEQAISFLTEHGGEIAAAFYNAFTENIPEESPLKGIIEAIENISTAITTLGPLIAGVFIFAEAAQGLAALSGIEAGLAALGGAFTTVAGVAGEVLGVIGAAVSTAFEPITGGAILGGIEEFITKVAMFFGVDGMAAVSIGQFAGPAVLGALIVANEDVQRIAGEVFGGLVDVIGGALDACSPILDTFKIVFETLEGAISVVVKTLENLFRPAIEEVIKYVEPVATKIKNDFKTLLERLNETIKTVADTLGVFFGPALEGLGKLLGTILSPLGTFAGFMINLAGLAFDALILVLTGILDFVKWFAEWSKPAMEALGSFFDTLGKGVEGMKKAFDTQFGSIVEWFAKLPERIMTALEESFKDFEELGSNIVKGLVDGAKKKWDDISSWWAGIPDAITGFFKDQLQIQSPSKVFHGIGSNTIEGFQSGAEEAWGITSQFFQGLLGAVDSYVADPIGTLLNAGREVINGFQGGVNEQWPTTQGFFGGVQGEIGGHFNGSNAWLDNYGKQMIEGYDTAIDTAFGAVRTFFGGIDDALGKILAESDKYLTPEGKKIVEGLKGSIENEYKGVDNFFGSLKGKMTDKFNGSDGWLSGKGKDTMGGFHTGLTNEWGSVELFLSNRGASVQWQFTDAGQWLNTAGQNIMIGLYNGLVDAWNNGDITSFVSEIAQWIIDNKGPESKDKALLVPAGGWIMSGLYNGLESAFTDDVMPFVESIATEMREGFDDTLETTRMFLSKMDVEFERFAISGKELLAEAGMSIMNGFMRGLEQGWESGRAFFRDITEWIQANKGPKQKDLNLLVPAGNWIMGGLRSGLEDAFRRDVMPFVESMADEMERGFGDPMLMAGTGIDGDGYSRSYGAPQVIVQHMEVRSERDIHKVSRELNELWRMEASGSLI